MENAERADHRAVAGHRVINAGEDHHAAVQGIEDREDHRRRDQDAAVGAEERLGRGCAEVEVPFRDHRGDDFGREHAEDRVVEEDVEKCDADDRKEDRERNVALRILDFFGDAVEVVPAFIRPERGDDREGDDREERGERRRFRGHGEEVGRLGPKEEPRDHDEADRKELQDHEDVLHEGARADPADLNERERHDGADRHDLLRDGAERQNRGERPGEGDGERRDRRARRENEVREAAHERSAFAVGFAKVDVASAGLRHHGAELGVADAAHERDETAHKPNEKRETEAHLAAREDDAADVEDPRADHDAGED